MTIRKKNKKGCLIKVKILEICVIHRFVILENLRYYLSIFNTSDPLYFGHKFKAYIKSGYMQGGSGYI